MWSQLGEGTGESAGQYHGGVLVSFAIPAHNEERLIGSTVAAIHRAAEELGIEHEVIVASDASTDGTADAARRAGARVVEVGCRQISGARNAAARAGRGDVLVFVDADTRVTSAAVREALAAIGAGAAGGGGPIRFDGEIPRWARMVLPVLNFKFRLLRLTGGCFLFCTRGAFEAAGGWDEGMYAAEEIEMAGRLKKQGRFVIVRSPVITSGRKLRAYSGWEIFKIMGRLAASGRGAMRDRSRLGIWYGPRREDPADAGDGSRRPGDG